MKTFTVFTPSGQDDHSALKGSVSNGGMLTLQDDKFRTVAAYPAGQWLKAYIKHPPKPAQSKRNTKCVSKGR